MRDTFWPIFENLWDFLKVVWIQQAMEIFGKTSICTLCKLVYFTFKWQEFCDQFVRKTGQKYQYYLFLIVEYLLWKKLELYFFSQCTLLFQLGKIDSNHWGACQHCKWSWLIGLLRWLRLMDTVHAQQLNFFFFSSLERCGFIFME